MLVLLQCDRFSRMKKTHVVIMHSKHLNLCPVCVIKSNKNGISAVPLLYFPDIFTLTKPPPGFELIGGLGPGLGQKLIHPSAVDQVLRAALMSKEKYVTDLSYITSFIDVYGVLCRCGG